LGSLSLSDNKNVIDLKKYKAERTKKRKEEELEEKNLKVDVFASTHTGLAFLREFSIK